MTNYSKTNSSNSQDKNSGCAARVNAVKKKIEAKVERMDPKYSKYINWPSCSKLNWAEKYWGSSLSSLETMKRRWDPQNMFHHCQSVGSSPSSGKDCCPSSTNG